MPTYVYETIPQTEGVEPKRFELRQSMLDEALSEHPETGEPVRRVVLGGFGYAAKGAAPSPAPGGG